MVNVLNDVNVSHINVPTDVSVSYTLSMVNVPTDVNVSYT